MKTVFFGLLMSVSIVGMSQDDCPEATLENYKKVMSSSFAENYTECPVIIEGQFYKEGYLTGYRKPKKLSKMMFFQCLNGDGESKKSAIGAEHGEFFVIDKEKSDLIFELNQGDNLRLTGVTFIQKFYGTEVNSFFIVSSIEKIK